ncbi:MAG: carboxymuconolactone decarboxylase family protein [Pseudomonadales bacterium]|nr:carboxymuconolactone decarboxylase family protein [Pseudomonadales bacterium]
MADWEDRIKEANETYSRFVPEAEPERVFASMERKLGALGTYAFTAVGQMWNRPQLSRRDRSLMIISVLAAQSRDEELVGHTRIGLRHGLSREEIEEINLHIAAYAGFPAAMAANRYMDEAFCEVFKVDKITDRKPADHIGDEERLLRAADVRKTLTAGRANDNPEQDLAALTDQLGGLGDWAMKWAFGEIWSRPELSRRDRSLVVIAILTALGQEAELAFHVPGGLNHGLKAEEIEEMMTHMCLYVGFPRAVDGMRAARQAIEKATK